MRTVVYEPEAKIWANGIELAYDSFGAREAPPIILIMGFTMPMILNEEQNMLKDTAKEFCGSNAPISQLRKLRDSNSNPRLPAAIAV